MTSRERGACWQTLKRGDSWKVRGRKPEPLARSSTTLSASLTVGWGNHRGTPAKLREHAMGKRLTR